MWRKRSLILFVLTGLITILCHAKAFSPFNRGGFSIVPPIRDFTFRIDDPPVITGQSPNPITINEEQSLTVAFSHLVVTDADDDYPNGFTLNVSAGANYSVNGNTITPVSNFTGTLSVPVSVSDGEESSNTFALQVVVTNINDAPVITGQNPISISEDQSVTINFSHLTVTDPDDSYPTDFTLSVGAGSNYTVNGTTITPSANFSGDLSVPVTVNDGEATSNTFPLVVTVNGSNDAPVITGQNSLSVPEDNSIRIMLTDLIVSDSDDTYPGAFTLTVLNGANYSVNGTTIIPAQDFVGTLSVPVQVNDGTENSNTFNVAVTVTPVNDAPVITGQQTISTTENQPIEIQLSQLTVTDVDNSFPSGFSLSVSAGTNYTVSGNTVTPAVGFSGSLTVPVSVSDGALSSSTFNLQVDVIAVNDPPVITGQNTLTVTEDNSITLQFGDLQVTDSDNIYPNGFAIIVHAGNDYTVSGATVIPSPNFNGNLSVGVSVSDGSAESQVFPVSISVTAVNDAPVIIGQASLSTSEDQPITINLTDLSVTDPDNSFPDGFTMTLSAGDNYSVSGTTIIPASDFKGTLFVPVLVNDGELNSNVFTMQINVADVNDPPIIIGQVPVSTPEDTPVSITLAHLDVLDPDNSYPVGFSMNISPGSNYSVSGSAITPAQDFTGTLNVSITVNDGASDSAPFNFQIQVGDSNDPPVITGQIAATTNEEEAFTLTLGHLSVFDPDNSYPTGFSILIAPGIDYAVSNNVITPALNFTGALIIPIRVNDGVNNSPTFDFRLDVLPVNDPPSFDAIANVNVLENAAPGTVQIRNISKGPNEDYQQLAFSVSSSDPAIVPNPVVSYDGTSQTASLAYSIVPNRSGLVTINIVATDNGGNTPPNQNSYSSTFQIAIAEINNAPTLDVIPAQAINEDAPLNSIPLTGITAGPSEAQPLAVTASTNRPDLFEVFGVTYTSPAATANLQVKPVANAFGTATVTITVTDNGSNISPSINSVTRSFALSILPINDPPVFVSNPVTVAAVDELYEYLIEITDEESESLPITAEQKPSWASLTTINGKKAKLAGTPPIAATGSTSVKLVVKDGLYSVDQTFELVVNSRPIVTSFNVSSQEDNEIAFQQNQFTQAYSDVNQHALFAVQITEMPIGGALFIGSLQVQPFDTIPAGSLSSLTFKPDKDFSGADAFQWKASDGYHFSKSAAAVNISISPVNDPPLIIMETDTLQYEVNGEPAALTTLFDVYDPDNDSLSSAEIAFSEKYYQPEYDLLLFENSSNIKINYDLINGKLSLNGKAPIDEYRQVIRRIRYNHLNTIDPALRLKTLTFVVNDGKLPSESNIRFVSMKFTFVELDIPTGFTPNGDNANDTWVITRPGGVDDFHKAVISVFNKRGFLVHQQVGFNSQWDGKFNGETLPAGTYYFTIDLKLRSRKIYKGVVMILR